MRQIRNYYPLLEGAGLTAHDMGPGAANGTLSANVIWLPKGVTIAASESQIISAAAAGFNSAEGSIEMLVRPAWNNADGAYHFFWQTHGGEDKRFNLCKTGASWTSLTMQGVYQGGLSYPWVANTLYHVVLNWGIPKLYINKILVRTWDAYNLGLGAANLHIGDEWVGPNEAFNGNIYYFIVRDVALTQAEVTEFYNFFMNQYI